MFYSDILPANDQTTLKVKLTNFSGGINTQIDTNLLPLNIAKNSYNFKFTTGSLKTGLGFKDLTIEYGSGTKTMLVPASVTEIQKVWVYKRYVQATQTFSPLVLFFSKQSGANNENEIYAGRVVTSANNFHSINNFDFTDVPVGMMLRIDGVDKFVFCPSNSTDNLQIWDSIIDIQSYPDAPEIKSLAFHADRLFATVGGDKSQLWFSAESDPSLWNAEDFSGGYIEICDERGPLNAVISYNNNLYIIRDFGITRLTGTGDQSNFVVKNLSLSNSQIYEKTATLCGDRILMFCQDGLYVFDGIEMNKLTLGFEELFAGVDNKNACAAFLNGKYYLACKMNFDDRRFNFDETNFVNNALIEYDINTGVYSILRGVDIRALTALQYQNNSKLIACFGGDYKNKLGELTNDGTVFGTPTTKVWESPYTDLDYPNKTKIIKSITLQNKFASQIGVCVDGKNYVFDVRGSQKAVRVPINLKGNLFSVGFYATENDAYISNPQIEINLE